MGRKMTTNDIQIEHHKTLLKMRRQDRIVGSDIFIEAWNIADNKQKKKCYRLLKKLEVDELKLWINELSNNRSISVLRQLASNHCIKDYCNMSKDELLKILTAKGVIHERTKCSLK